MDAPKLDSAVRRARRLAEDLARIAAANPSLEAHASTIAIYNRVLADVEAALPGADLRDVPRYAAGAPARYAELLVLAGQLAEIADLSARTR